MVEQRERAIWRKVDGVEQMPEVQRLYLDWLIDPLRTPSTHKDWAAQNSIPDRTLRHWRNDLRFQREWRARANEANVSPERTQAVIDNLWRAASNGTGMSAVKAGELYLRYVELFQPTQKVIVQDDSIEKMSDEDLRALLES